MNPFAKSLALLALAAAPALAGQVSVETARGPVAVDSDPGTVVVFDMAALDSLDALGVPVANSVNAIYLPRLARYQGDAGTLFEPDYEAVAATRPALIVAGGRSASAIDALSQLAPTLDMTILGSTGRGGDDVFAIGRARIAAYGAIFGREAEAAALIAALDAQLAATRAAAAGRGTALIVQTNGPSISVYGGGSRYGWLHDALGIPHAAAGIQAATHGEAVSFEFIRAANPDWLIVIDRAAAIGDNAQGARATLDNPLVRDTAAWRAGRIVYLDSAEIYLADGGFTSLMTTLRLIEAGFAGAAN